MDAKSEVRKCGLMWFLPALLMVVFGFLLGSSDVFADDSGGWIGPTPPSIQPGTGGGTGGGGGGGTYSWIYYESQTSDKLSSDFPFTPTNWNTSNYSSSDDAVYISKDCSGKTEYGKPRGFWHLGTDGEFGDYYGAASKCGIYSFDYTSDDKLPGFPQYTLNASTGWNCILNRSGYNYSSPTSGSYGHTSTRSVGNFKTGTFAHWLPDNSSKSVSHEIFYGDDIIFKATKSGSASTVLEDYKKAYKIKYKEDYPGESLPDNAYVFCYWEGMEKVTLTAYAVTEDKKLLNSGNAIASVTDDPGKAVSISANDPYEGYGFQGWYPASANSADGCKTYKQGWPSSPAIVINGTKYNEKLVAPNHTICAVYKKKEEKKYTLTAKAVDSNGSELGPTSSSGPVSAGSTATVTAPSVQSYEFTGRWRDKPKGSVIQSSGESYKVSKMMGNVTVYPVYRLTTDCADVNERCSTWPVYPSVEYDYDLQNVKCEEGREYYFIYNGVCYNKVNEHYNHTFVAPAINEPGIKFAGWGSCDYISDRSDTIVVEKSYEDSNMIRTAVYKKDIFSFQVNYLGFDAGDAPPTFINNDVAYKENFGYAGPPKVSGYTRLNTVKKEQGNPAAGKCMGVGNELWEENYEKNVIEGKSDVGTKTTDWTQGGKDMRKGAFVIENCSPTNGCEVTFKHWLRRKSGSGTSKYEIKRTSNLTSRVKNIDSITGELSFGLSDNEEKEVRTETVTLYPGMVVCETMTFDNWPGKNSKGTNIVCAHAAGNSQCEKGSADCPNNCEDEEDSLCKGGDSLLRVGVKNENVEQYQKYQKEVYAKPGDTIKFKATYFPQLQYACHLAPQAMQIDGSLVISGNTRLFTQTIFNNNRGLRPAWNNAFAVRWDDPTSGYTYRASNPFKADCGKTDTRRATSDGYKVKANKDVGTKIEGVAKTNEVDASKTTPSQIKFSSNGMENVGNVITSQIESEAGAKVPYNFETATSVLNEPGYVYAGETLEVKYEVFLKKRNNGITVGNYRTKAPGAKRFIRVCWIDEGDSSKQEVCKEEEDSQKQSIDAFGSVNDNQAWQEDDIKAQYTEIINIPDITAGSRFCVMSVVTPGNSGGDTNIDPDGFNGESVSKEVCFKVAKKPNFQVWGGELFVNGNAEAFVSKKKYLNTWGYRVR